MIKEKGLPEEIADRIYEYVQLNGMVVDVSNGEMFSFNVMCRLSWY